MLAFKGSKQAGPRFPDSNGRAGESGMSGAGATARIDDLALFIICQKRWKGVDDTIVMAMMASGLSPIVEMILPGWGAKATLTSPPETSDRP